MKTIAIIGANFGDEGKGVMVDYFAHKLGKRIRSTVVRFNSGAQAGHTVQRPLDAVVPGLVDDRHVFRHYGSGFFSGSNTVLSRFFSVHPILFRKEHDDLKKQFGMIKSPYVDPRCIIVTPYDMLLNQAIENHRGIDRLGSTGTGVSEATLRSYTKYNLQLFHLEHGDLQDRLISIRDHYVEERLASVGLTLDQLPSDIHDYIKASEVLLKFISDVKYFSKHTISVEDVEVMRDPVVFEGAQGLLLDRVTGTFPHVTQSRTGVTNVIQLCDEAGIEEVDVVYVTRPYVTRHGAGPLRWECVKIAHDETNFDNPYQGHLRYATLDEHALRDRIQADLRQAEPESVRLNPFLAITCIDHIKNGRSAAEMIGRVIGLPYYTCDGPTREHVSFSERL
jgi:adenylosuccinate synthase